MSALQTQLGKVLLALEKDPENVDLLHLKDQVEKAISLSAASFSQNTLFSTAVNVLPLHTALSTLALKVGDKCEALCLYDNRWKGARILSIRNTDITVSFDDRGATQHCKMEDVRPVLEKLASTITMPVFEPQINKKRHKCQNAHKPSRAEYIKVKEEEQKVKQDAWLQFSKRLRK